MMEESPEVDPNDPIHKRNFLLMLSPAEGQSISEKVGFSRPSEDVQEAETFDIVSNWITLAASGAMLDIRNASEWVTEYLSSKYKLSEEELDDITTAYYTYSVALISYMIQIGSIDLYAHGEVSTNLENFIGFFPSTGVTIIKETDEDE